MELQPSKVWLKGQPCFKSNPNKINTWSGLNIEVSSADFNEFEKQKLECLRFLEDNGETIVRLTEYKGVELCFADFGIEWRDVPVQSDYFEPNLIKALARVGLGLETSQYPPGDD